MKTSKTMNGFRLLILAVVASFLPSASAAAQSHGAQLDYGRVEGSFYTNDYFHLQFAIPSQWRVQGAETKEKLMQEGRKLTASDDQKVQEARDASMERTVQLLTLFRYDEASNNGSPIASFICGAEKLVVADATPTQYANSNKAILLSMQKPMKIDKDTYHETVGGVDFAVFEMISGDGVVRQRYYSTILRGYALFFVSTYVNGDDLPTLNAIIRSVSFMGRRDN